MILIFYFQVIHLRSWSIGGSRLPMHKLIRNDSCQIFSPFFTYPAVAAKLRESHQQCTGMTLTADCCALSASCHTRAQDLVCMRWLAQLLVRYLNNHVHVHARRRQKVSLKNNPVHMILKLCKNKHTRKHERFLLV